MTATISSKPKSLKALEGNGQVVFRYAEDTNPNGSLNDIAGVINAKGNVLGMMPHPENSSKPPMAAMTAAASSLRRSASSQPDRPGGLQARLFDAGFRRRFGLSSG